MLQNPVSEKKRKIEIWITVVEKSPYDAPK